MTTEKFIAEMRERLTRNPTDVGLRKITDVNPYCGGSSEEEAAFFNDIGATIAVGYSNGKFSYHFSERVTDGLWQALMDGMEREPRPAWPDLFYDVYLAFDVGCYQHAGDDPLIDPIETYTNPSIRSVLERFSIKG